MKLDKARVAAVVNTQFGRDMLIEGDRAQAGNAEKEQVWNLLVDEIEPDPEQPRRHFNAVALQELADDIARRGVLQPLVVRLLPGDPVRYRIIVGERRWRASKIAGKPRVPCLIRVMDPGEVRQAQLVENVVREGLSDVERGIALRTLYEEVKRTDPKTTWEDVARRVGLSRVQIHLLSRLSHLPEEIVVMINTGRLSGSHGVELGRLNGQREAQTGLASEAARATEASPYGLSVTALRRRVDALLQDSHGMAVRRRSSLTEEKLVERAEELSSNLRPNLTQDVRDRLRRTAEDILRFLQQGQDGGPEALDSVLSQHNKPAVLSQHNKVDTDPPHGPDDRRAGGDEGPQKDTEDSVKKAV